MHRDFALAAALWACAAGLVASSNTSQTITVPSVGKVVRIRYPGDTYVKQLPLANGNTHELAIVKDIIWVTQWAADRVLRIRIDREKQKVKHIQQIPTPKGSVPHGVVTTSRDYAWVTYEYGDKLVKINKRGKACKEIPLPQGSGAHGLVHAADGTLWYAGKEGAVIGQADPRQGKVIRTWETGFNSTPIYLSQSPVDHSIWGTLLYASSLVRITQPAGQLDIFPLQGAGDGLVQAVIQNEGETYVARVKKNSTVEMFVQDKETGELVLPNSMIPLDTRLPIAIKPDKHGNMWFTEQLGSRIGRIPAGLATGPASGLNADSFDYYDLPYPGSMAASLAISPSGTIWTQTFSPFGLARLKDGVMKQFWLPLGGPIAVPPFHNVPHRIDIGDDGVYWYTDLAGDRLGRSIIPKDLE